MDKKQWSCNGPTYKGPAHYPVPANIGYVSLGQDYRNVVYIDCADEEDPVMVYCYDGEANHA